MPRDEGHVPNGRKIHNSGSARKSSFLAVFSAPRPWLELYCLIPRTGALTPTETTALTTGSDSTRNCLGQMCGRRQTSSSCSRITGQKPVSWVTDCCPHPPSLPKARLALDKKKSLPRGSADGVNNVSSVSTRSKAAPSLPLSY